jgi:hypothetical protein
MGDRFESIFVASELEQMVIDIVKKWMPTYIAELQFQIGWDGSNIPAPRRYTTRTRVQKFAEDQLPTFIAVSPGLASPPVKEGNGSFRAWWTLGCAVICSAKDEDSTKALARFYAAAVRAILLQHSSLDSQRIGGIEWRDESYDDIDDDTDIARVIAAGTNYFRIEVTDIVTWGAGPKNIAPPTPAGDPWPGESRWPDPPISPDPQEELVASASAIVIKREAL